MNQTKEKEKNQSEKLFTKKELEAIVEQRLKRERKNSEDFSEIREILLEMRKDEPYRSLSNAEVADKLKQLFIKTDADKTEKTEEISDADPDAEEKNTAISDIETKEHNAQAENGNDGMPDTKEMPEKYDAETERRQKEVERFLAEYDEKTFVSAMNDKAFRAFCIGKDGDILALYNSYRAFVAALAESPEFKKYRAARAGLASTGFSGSASSAVDYGSMLTPNQKQLAKSVGMSYKQYAELISQIPSKKLNSSK